MKRHSLVLRLFSLWMALLVLTSSVGLTVQQHTCHMSGRTQRAVVLTPRHACAPAEQSADETGCAKTDVAKASAKDDCCAFSAHHHKVDSSAHDVASAKVPAPALLAVLPTQSWAPLAFLVPAAAPAQVWHASDSSPPPRAGRALLTFVCTLVV